MFDKQAQTSVPINALLARRWSGRAFDPARAVSRDQVTALLEAVRWSPSCMGDQPWRLVVCDRQANAQAWQNAFDCLAEGNQAWAVHAPLLLLAAAALRFSGREADNRWGQYDTGAACMSLCLQATDLGLMAHQMGGFDVQQARRVFAVPEDFQPMAMIAVGYQLPREAIPEALRERELAQRDRHPLGHTFFDGSWDRPLSA